MYGTVTKVAALASTWTSNGEFLDEDIYDIYVVATVPSLAQVESWLEQMSAVIDLALATEGFVTPLEHVTAIASVSSVVEAVVADLVHASHKSGRFFTKKALEGGSSPMFTANEELTNWVKSNTVGFKTLGVKNVSNAVGASSMTFDVL